MLSLDRLSFGYRPHEQQIADLSLDLEAGEVLGLLGPNGAGKTTLVGLITGQLRPRAGHVHFDRAPVRLGRPGIALVPQEYAFYPRLKVRENLAYFAGLLALSAAERRHRIAAALDQAGLTELVGRRAGDLSGGYKRRLNFAIALLQKPQLLLLDEPTANVDPHSRQDILTAVRELSAAGTAIIYTSHLLDEVEAIATQIAVMHAGQIVLRGSTAKLLSDASSQVRFSTEQPLPPPLCQQLQLESLDSQTYLCDLQKASLSLAELTRALEQAGHSPSRLSYGQRRLEEVYLQCLAHTEATA
ncbi:ABC transporter ATP-binding protein [Gilvimarinus xylanilyticus]|uniref:ABC transporter ATP-binding protein n=1 Tax=Gilvimarinus xylanilyticus TaxID=2944139 RepID=A0A9X2HYN2_9GAMM|nr:ABC transporter ATP-binding protein [Gilvimarinus xylanilyticus]MCP8900139.1 ABC transporter ATP-binding protein [Gilvimarinus xylanilyticus]